MRLSLNQNVHCMLLTAVAGALDETEPVGDRYVGQNSIPALLREQSTSSDKNDSVDIRRDMRSILGLDNSAPFPLMSQHHMHRIAQDISTELPSDREVMKYIRIASSLEKYRF